MSVLNLFLPILLNVILSLKIEICNQYFCSVRKHKQPQILKQVLIEDCAAEGKSLARVNGKVVFVERTVPGDIVDIQLTKSKKTGQRVFPYSLLNTVKSV